MEEITFTLTFDSDSLKQEQIELARDFMFEYCGIGAFTDDFNLLLNSGYGLYCIAVDSGNYFFKYMVSKGWSSPYKKNKLPDPTALKI